MRDITKSRILYLENLVLSLSQMKSYIYETKTKFCFVTKMRQKDDIVFALIFFTNKIKIEKSGIK